MTTPKITPADLAAAAAFTLASGEWIQEDLLAEHFAAWRVKERERCVAVLKSQVELQRKCSDRMEHNPYAANCHLHAASTIQDLISQLTPEANNDQ